MVQYGDYVFVNCWSYQNRILKIDTRTDEIVAELELGIQPTSLALDKNGKLWSVTDGGFEGKVFDYLDHNKLWKILQDMGIPDHLTCLLRNLYAGQKQQLELDMEQQTGSK